MRLYICYAALTFCILLSIGELQGKSSMPPKRKTPLTFKEGYEQGKEKGYRRSYRWGYKFGRIGRHIMIAADSIFAALFTMNASHVQEAYDVSRSTLKNIDAD